MTYYFLRTFDAAENQLHCTRIEAQDRLAAIGQATRSLQHLLRMGHSAPERRDHVDITDDQGQTVARLPCAAAMKANPVTIARATP